MVKNPVLGPILATWAKIQTAKFLFKNLVSSVTRYRDQISCTASEKTNDPILKKKNLTDGRTDRQTDGQRTTQTDESDFIRRCPTKVERPTMKC